MTGGPRLPAHAIRARARRAAGGTDAGTPLGEVRSLTVLQCFLANLHSRPGKPELLPIRTMRILHILDHSLPLQSGYVYRTLGIVNQQRALGWEPVLLTSGKHYARGPERERIGAWEFLRTPMPTGLVAKLPWLRELKIVTDLDQRLDDVIKEVRPDILHAHSPALNALPAIRAGRRHRVPVVYEMRSLWEDAVGGGTSVVAGLRYRATKLLETHALRRADAVTTI